MTQFPKFRIYCKMLPLYPVSSSPIEKIDKSRMEHSYLTLSSLQNTRHFETKINVYIYTRIYIYIGQVG